MAVELFPDKNAPFDVVVTKKIAEGLVGCCIAHSTPVLVEPYPDDRYRVVVRSEVRDWLRGELTAYEERLPVSLGPASRPWLRAKAWTGDGAIEVEFDVSLWFQCATDDELDVLAACGFRGITYPASEVVDWTANINPEAEKLFNYVEERMGAPNEVGYGVEIDPKIALEWVRYLRPDVFERVESSYKQAES